jgi:hypothetical protein
MTRLPGKGHARAGGSHGLPREHAKDIRAAMTVMRWLNYGGSARSGRLGLSSATENQLPTTRICSLTATKREPGSMLTGRGARRPQHLRRPGGQR